jgi:hypothetical protein
MTTELTDEQINRQDEVDNRIFNMVYSLFAQGNRTNIHWDIELIGSIRDVIIKYYHMNPEEQQEFYPYLKD